MYPKCDNVINTRYDVQLDTKVKALGFVQNVFNVRNNEWIPYFVYTLFLEKCGWISMHRV